jgi:molybdenum cofactor cytidylyltransferase
MISGVVLAAGSSTRLGTPKQLLELGGRPLLQHVVDSLAASTVDSCVVVLGHEAPAVEGALSLPPGTSVVVNPDYERGQSTSLSAGLEALDEACEAAVIVLGDQPGMSAAIVDRALETYRASDAPIVRSTFCGAPGHPVVVARSQWGLLRAATGDEGARGLLAHPSVRVHEVEMGAPLVDVDTWEEYERLRRGA